MLNKGHSDSSSRDSIFSRYFLLNYTAGLIQPPLPLQLNASHVELLHLVSK